MPSARLPLVLLSFLLLLPLCACAQEKKERVERDIAYRSGDVSDYAAERCKLDLLVPAKPGFATIVWFHGGGLTGGNKQIPKQLVGKGYGVAAPNYRLYPKIKAPVYVEDAAAAVAWVVKNIETYGGDSNKVFVSGHSAGGYLTSMVGLDKSYLKKHGVDANQLAGLMPFSGHTITHFTVRKERGIDGKVPVVDHMAPLFHVRKDAPPLILMTGDRDTEMLGRYEENAYLYRMMKVVGHQRTELYEFQGFGHNMVDPGHKVLLDSVRKILKDISGEKK